MTKCDFFHKSWNLLKSTGAVPEFFLVPDFDLIKEPEFENVLFHEESKVTQNI